MEAPPVDPQTLIDSHGLDATVLAPNGMEMTLGAVLQFEELGCTEKDPAKRHDPVKRAGKLAIMLDAGGSLLPEFQHLLPDTE